MQLKSISLAVLTALLASSTILLSVNMPTLSQSMRVLVQAADARKAEADRLVYCFSDARVLSSIAT